MTLDELLTILPSATKIGLYRNSKKDSNLIDCYYAEELTGTLNEVIRAIPEKNSTLTIIIKEDLC